MERGRTPLSILTLLLVFRCTFTDDRDRRETFSDLPRIITSEGHMIFKTGTNHNITFLSAAGGYITVDGEDIKVLSQNVKQNKQAISRMNMSTTGIPSTLDIRLSQLERRFNNSQGSGPTSDIVTRLANLESKIPDSLFSRLTQVEQSLRDVQSSNSVQETIDSLVERLGIVENRVTGLQNAPTPTPPATQTTAIRRLNSRLRNLRRQVTALRRLLRNNECQSNPCRNGGTCVDMYNGFICRCPAAWKGANCGEDVNECVEYASTDLGCQNGATCVNMPGAFRCQCTANWHGIRCSESHEDCTGASNEALCGHGTCINRPRTVSGQAKYTCICDVGWRAEGANPACVADVDECSGRDRRCSIDPPVQCINLPGTFHCGSCPAGFTGDGFSCANINECAVNNGGCSLNPRVQCVDTRGSRQCGPCPPGFQGDGVNCNWVGICNNNNGGCSSLATCRELSGMSGRICTCPQGYIGNGEGASGCVQQAPATGPCAISPCLNGGVCRNVGSSYQCTCQAGFTGQQCQTNNDDCASNPCQHGGTCVDGINSYTCQCSSSYTGNNCQTEAQLQSCGGRLNGESGSLTYPQQRGTDYPDNVNCAWRIYSTPGKIIRLHFDRFALEQHTNCNYDYFEIHDGPSASSHMIGKYCGNSLPNGGVINSTRHQLYLWFYSDAYGGGEGFALHWTSALPNCGGSLIGQDHGSINSPGYPGRYPHNRTCAWTVTVSPSSVILFSFAFLAIETHRNCSYDYLEIRDGLLDTSPLLHRYCNSSSPPPLRSTGPTAYLKFHSDGGLNDRGFHITYTALQQGGQSCGGRFTADSGEIKSPNFPNPYHHDANCIWLIEVSAGEVVKLTFKAMDLEQHVNCEFDFVEVRDGLSEESPLIGRYCSNTIPTRLMTSGNTAMVHFRSDSSASGSGFRLLYTVACGGTFSDSSGVVQSPYYPDSYPSNKDCVYLLSQPVGYRVSMVFTSFDIEAGTSQDNCDFDYLEVRDGEGRDSPLIGRYCGNQMPPAVSSSQNFLWLKFVSDGATQNLGFRAIYNQTTGGCGGILRSDVGRFSSPGHPNSYPHGVDCEWLISVTPGLVIRLTFHTFALEGTTPACSFDRVTIYDNTTASPDSQNGRYCGSTVPPVTTSSENVMLVTFHSDSSLAHEGFMASYVALNGSHLCGSILRNDVGVITSPNYPGHYPHNQRCIWTIIASEGNQIRLNITDFMLEGNRDCRYDGLEIRNGGYSNSPLLGKYCGTSIDNILVSHSNKLWLKFQSDSSRTHSGFRIEYDTTSTGCGSDLTATSGSFVSPNYPSPYGANVECFWTITVSQGSRIQIAFVDFELESHGNCGYDYVLVRDGGPTGSQLARVCGRQVPAPILSLSNRLWIKYRTDMSQHFRGFYAFYSSICNQRLTKARGVIESPNFPRNYPPNHNCTWIIETTMGNTLNLSFSHMDMIGSNNCRRNYVKIKDGENRNDHEIGTYCGTNLPPFINSTGKFLRVEFLSFGYSIPRTGFRLEYVTNGCGGELTGPTGNLSSPGYPEPYPHRRLCVWTITVQTGKYIELTIDDFDLETHSSCMFDVLEVYNGGHIGDPRLTQLCHRQKSPQVLSSSGNVLFIRFASDSSIAGNGFHASYRQMDGGCGGNFSTPTASISSRNYPSNYPHNTNCEWLITVQEGRSIILTFQEFDVEGSNDCRYDYVAVYDGQNRTQLMKHCGTDMPTPAVYQSSGNQMYIHMHTDSSVSAKGFLANYTLGCGGIITVTDDGVLTSPNYPDLYDANLNCTWVLRSDQASDRIILTFTHMDTREDEGCENADVVHVYDGEDSSSIPIGTYCGSTIPGSITSRGSALAIVFTSYVARTRSGFRAVYSKSLSSCGGDITAQSGSFLSPGYPVNYPNDIECVWTLNVSPGNRIQVSFSEMRLEQHDYCNLDYVELREKDVTGRLIGRYCGHDIPNNITAANGVWVKFRSDNDGTDNGFIAQFNAVYGGDIYGTSGQIASPRYPNHYLNIEADYSWTVTTEIGMRIQVTVVVLDTDGFRRTSCLFDYLQLLDGGSDDSPEIGKYCVDIPEPIITTTNQLRVVFHSDMSVSGMGFLLNWEATSLQPSMTTPSSTAIPVPGCGAILRANESIQSLTSPGYPDGYTSNLDCTWTISTDVGHHIRANVTDIDTETHHSCNYDSVKFTERFSLNRFLSSWDRLLGKYCGRRGNVEPITTAGNTLRVNFVTDSSVNGSGFALDYQSACGGLVKRSIGQISSPGYPGNYPANTNCTWVIWGSSHRTIRFRFNQTFDIDGTAGSCAGDYLEIKNGQTLTSPSINNGTDGRFCGNSVPTVSESGSHFVFLRFISDGSGSGAGFSLTFAEVQVTCGGNLQLLDNIPEGYITSPNYPQRYLHNLDCTWIIMAPASETIQFDFEDFQIEGGSGCQYDFVRIRDGGTVSSPIIGTYCSSTQPNTTTTTGNIAFIRFRTDDSIPKRGFKLKYKIATCGGRFVGQRGEIRSPNYPMNYDNNLDCEWYISVPIGHYITIEIQDLGLPSWSSNNCTNDFLEIREFNSTGELITQKCSMRDRVPAGVTLRSADNSVYIHFQSDARQTAKGFKLKFEASIEECGGDFTTPTGAFTSPNYPGYYPNPRRCEWRLRVQEGRRIRLTFDGFNIETNRYCNLDYVKVYNGLLDDSPSIGKKCGTTIPEPIQSAQNEMRVVFVTRGSVTNRGFSVTYDSLNEAACGGTLTTASGVISSPGYGITNYTDNLQCIWRIQSHNRSDTSLIISFDDIRLEKQLVSMASGCHFDYIEFKEGNTANGIPLARVCTNETVLSVPLVTPSNAVWARFKTDFSESAPGFQLTYRYADCGGILTEESGSIASPNYPQNFGPNAICAWNILAPEGTQIVIQFTTFNIPDSSNCSGSSLDILNGKYASSPSIGKFCGTVAPATFRSQSNGVRLIFRSGSSVTSGRFQLFYNFASGGCGGLYHSKNGSLTSPNYPRSYPHLTECIWDINVENGYFINLTFVPPFDLEGHGDCRLDYVEVFDYSNTAVSTSRGRWCANLTPPPQRSTSNRMVVKFRSDAATNGAGFKVIWDTRCGGILTGDSGTFVSPGYPDRYANRLECNYTIQVDPQKYIILTFDDEFFDVEGLHLPWPSCSFDYIAVYRGNMTKYPYPLAKVCGRSVPQPISSVGSLHIRFVTDGSVVGKGFKARYTTTECGGQFTEPSGEIQTPSHPTQYFHNSNCSWIITVSANRAVELKFTHFGLETHARCQFDYVEIHDGADLSSPLIGRYCGSVIPGRIRTTGNTMFLNFVSDSSVSLEGFKASYWETYGELQDCGGVLNSTSGSFSSIDIDGNGLYENDLDCRWTIIVGDNKIAKINFANLNIERALGGQCTYDYLKIYDGFSADDPIIGTYCGSAPPGEITATSNFLFVHFHSDSQTARSGFTATYSQDNPFCGGTFAASTRAQPLTSPGFPNPVGQTIRCRWVIEAPEEGQQVRLIPNQLNLITDSSCMDEYVEFRDSPLGDRGQSIHLCSIQTGQQFDSIGRTVQVNFATVANSMSQGFSLNYAIANCNQTLRANSGRITSPGFPNNYPTQSNCETTIQTAIGTTLTLYFTSFMVEPHSECRFDYLQINNGSSRNDTIVSKVCGLALPDPVFLTSNVAFVKFVTDLSVTHSGYDISYTATTQGVGCGGNMTGINGSLTSPGYPGNYSNQAVCTWLITVPARRVVTVSFTDMRVSGSTNCDTDYVQVYNGDSERSMTFGRHCGSELPGQLQASGNTAFVKYVSSATGNPLIFRITYSS
ncbi:hypothetical protein ScPMuIL_012565 [Solemya velum]